MLGKREVGELSIFDLVILLIIADIASLGMDNDDFFIPSILCLFVLVVLQKILSLCLLKISRLRGIIDGKPTIIIYDGILKIKNMERELYTMDDLVSQMHLEHIESISEIRLAILETNGTLSIFRKTRFNNSMLPVVISGDLVVENIKVIGINSMDILQAFKYNNLDLKKIIYADYLDGKINFFYRKNRKEEDLKVNTISLVQDI